MFEPDKNGLPNLGKKVEVGFTSLEQHAINLTIELTNVYAQIVQQGGREAVANQDMAEFVAHIHPIQNAIMAQLAGRTYPQYFRQLGGVVGG